MKISFVRGAYLNNFEGQNYNLPITGYSSLIPLDSSVPFPVVKCPSIADVQKISFLNKPIKYTANRTLGDSQILFGLEKYITGSDIVHVADPHYYYSYQAAILKSQGKIKKLVSTWWETIPFNNEGTGAKKRIKKFSMSQVDYYICYSERAKKCMEKEGLAQNKISLIPLGVDLTRFAPQCTKRNTFTILFVGRLIAEKGIMDAYQAFRLIAKERKDVLLKVVGSGPLERELRQKIQEDRLEKRVTLEKIIYRDMPEVYNLADILCVPSKKTDTWEEQLGMVFIEAMASGVPIVSYNTGAIAEVVESAGILVEQNNIQQLTVSISQLIETRELRKKLGTMGRERAEKLYDAKKTREKIYRLYKTLNPKL